MCDKLHVRRRFVRSCVAAFALSAAGVVLLAGCPAFAPPPGGSPSSNDNVDLARAIDEADIVKYDNGYFYISNPFTGLRIIDARQPSNPTAVGGAALQGRTVELLLKDNNALLVTSADFFTCAGEPVGFGDDRFTDVIRPNYQGSRLYILDVTDKANILQRRVRGLEGYATTTRLVGDVVYVAGYRTQNGLPTGARVSTFISSINVADPDAAEVVDTQVFTGAEFEMQLTSSAAYIVGKDPQLLSTSLVTYVDISDPTGAMVIRDQFRVPGLINDRFAFDEYNGVFRIVTSEYPTNYYDDRTPETVALYTYDLQDPDDITRIAQLPLAANRRALGVRFDGPRGYAAMNYAEKPFFVLDLSDPAAPTIAAKLESPGNSAHFVPAGDKVIGVGYTGGSRPTITLYDVSDIKKPRIQDVAAIGREWDSTLDSEVFVDHRALKVLPDAELILLPFSRYDFETIQDVDRLKLISWRNSELIERGSADHEGLVRRAGLVDDRVWVLSDLAFQTVNIDDMNKPTSLKSIELISDQELLDAGLNECADSARVSGQRYYYYGDGCGYYAMLPLFGGLLALSAVKVVRRRK
jgi:hypothetical protein